MGNALNASVSVDAFVADSMQYNECVTPENKNTTNAKNHSPKLLTYLFASGS